MGYGLKHPSKQETEMAIMDLTTMDKDIKDLMGETTKEAQLEI